MIIENLTTLKINQLTKAQYEAALASGTVNENELYMTEESNVDLTDFAEHIANADVHVTADEKAAWSEKYDKPTVVTGTLSAGSTSITLSNDNITTNSVIDIYTNVYGVNPTAVSATEGNIILTFDSQSSDINVRVEVK